MQGQALSKKGLRFEDEQVYECFMVSAINASNTKDKDLVEEASDDQPLKDIKLKDTPQS